MLIQMVQTFIAKPERLAELADAVYDYEHELAVAGYVGRRRRSLYTDPATQRVILLATIQHPDAVQDILKSEVPAVTAKFAEIKDAAIDDPTTVTFPTINTRDEHYCLHSRWREIVMICDPIQGHSGMRCNECGGVVARYKLDLQRPSPEKIWQWEVAYERIYDLWRVSPEYREWAEEQLSGVNSPITQTGLQLARQITEQNGITMLYYLHLKQEGLDRNCPCCGKRMHEAIGTIWNVSCRECAVAIGRG